MNSLSQSHMKAEEEEEFFHNQGYGISAVPSLYHDDLMSMASQTRRASVSSNVSGHSSSFTSSEAYHFPSTPASNAQSPTLTTIAPQMLHSTSSSSSDIYNYNEPQACYDSLFYYNQDNTQEVSQDLDLKYYDDQFYAPNAASDAASRAIQIAMQMTPQPILQSSPYSMYEMEDVRSAMHLHSSPHGRVHGARRHSAASRIFNPGSLPLVVTSADKHHKCQYKTVEGLHCDKKFKRQEHLRRHERTHTGDKPHPCPIHECHKSFSRRDNLKAHWKTHGKRHGRNKFIPGLPENPEDYYEDCDPSKSYAIASML